MTVGAGMSGCSTANHTAIVEGSESRYRWMSSGTGPSRTITSCAGGSVCSIVPDCTARSSSRSVLPPYTDMSRVNGGSSRVGCWSDFFTVPS